VPTCSMFTESRFHPTIPIKNVDRNIGKMVVGLNHAVTVERTVGYGRKAKIITKKNLKEGES
jgi:hypothetical protein